MTTIPKAGLHLVAGCALALLVATGGATFAHAGWHHGGGNTGPFGTGPVHGPGSSHDPIVHHPLLPGPASNLKPIAIPGPVVRDHRHRPGSNRFDDCRHNWSAPRCANEVRDHRTPPLTSPVQWSPL